MNPNRLLVLVEGHTEVTFVNAILRPHLGNADIRATMIGKGGINKWDPAKREILRFLKQDTNLIVTTIVDYYGLPSNWPGKVEADGMAHDEKAPHIQKNILESIGTEYKDYKLSDRLFPFVMMHEFESLLFSDCDALASAVGRPAIRDELQRVKDQFDTPEHINNSFDTKPAKRILNIFPDYQKVLHGSIAAKSIGLKKMRAECPHFNSWITKLEQLPVSR